MSAQVQKKQKRSIKTFVQRKEDVTRDWYIVDASDATLGRVATAIAKALSGKNKVTFTPHVDAGDHVIVVNAANLKVTGAKLQDKMYYHYSGYPGGLKEQNLEEVMKKDPGKAIRDAVYGMLPKNKLRPEMMQRLRVYPGMEHKHEAQTPTKLEIK
jgi:large subunit ribosomal protein L13